MPFETTDLETVIDAFVDRMAADMIIGFQFEGKDLVRVKKHEFELARKHLFGEGRYTGRPIGPLHVCQRINKGQFRRRLAILRTVLTDLEAPPTIIERWIQHDQALERVITDGTDCVA